MFDKLPFFSHISCNGPVLDFGLYAILLLIEVFWFITMTFYMIRLFRLSIRGYVWNPCNFQYRMLIKLGVVRDVKFKYTEPYIGYRFA